MKKLTAILFCIILLFALTACGETEPGGTQPDPEQNTQSVEGVKLKMITPNGELLIKLVDCAASRDWVARLKLGEMTLEFTDFAGSEKIATPTPKLNISGSVGCDPFVGDITIYKPWGNIAVFYRDSSAFSSDLTLIGKIEGDGIKILAMQNGSFSVIIQLA